MWFSSLSKNRRFAEKKKTTTKNSGTRTKSTCLSAANAIFDTKSNFKWSKALQSKKNCVLDARLSVLPVL